MTAWSGVDEPQGGEVADVGGGDLRVVGEVEVLDGGGLFEAGLADPADERGGVAAGDLVLAEHLEELEVAELPGAGLGEAGFEGVEHPGELQGAQRRLELVAAGHDATSPSMANRRAGPWRCAGAAGVVGVSTVVVSVPAARIPLTVR